MIKTTLTIAIGSDHRGFNLKKALIEDAQLGQFTIEWLDVGTCSTERTDYPIFSHKIAQALQEAKADCGIALCGSGVGMAIAANRFKHIYAGVAWNKLIARMAKEDDNVNLLVIPADFTSLTDAREIITQWLSAEFKGSRYAERLTMLDKFGSNL